MVVTYKGEGIDEKIIERVTFSNTDQILMIEKPIERLITEYNYDNKGLLEKETNYYRGNKHGKTKYFYKGKLFEEQNWYNGLEHGEWISYDHNGKISDCFEYVYGSRNEQQLLIKFLEGIWKRKKISFDGTDFIDYDSLFTVYQKFDKTNMIFYSFFNDTIGYTLQHHLVSDINYPLDCEQLFIDKTGGIIHRGFEGLSWDGKTTWKEIVERGNQKFKIRRIGDYSIEIIFDKYSSETYERLLDEEIPIYLYNLIDDSDIDFEWDDW